MTSISSESPSPALAVGLERWLRLRWWLAPGQVAAIAAAGPLPPQVPFWWLALLCAVPALPGILLKRWPRTGRGRILPGALILGDMVVVAIALGLCGGPSNPFSVLFLLHVTLACVLVGPVQGWISLGVAAVLYLALFLAVPGAPTEHHAHAHGASSELGRHLWSMYFAFVAVGILVVTFVSSVMRTLEQRESDLSDARARADRNERLANITVLAAGTAHEMATPLATIAVTAKEMEHAAVGSNQQDWATDARLIRSEVERCRRLLDELRGRAGAVEGEAPGALTVGEAVLAATACLPRETRARVSVAPTAGAATLFLPRTAFVQVLGNILRNAVEASEKDSPVEVDAITREGRVIVSVRDKGHGMESTILSRAREPFFTTKPHGAGLGLGLFLADRFARDVGGSLCLDSSPGHGTEVRLELPT